jgi:valyl-tRNA synthetase
VQYPGGLPAMGADALRFTLLTGSTPGKDLNLSLEAVEANRNFANKLWNVGRLVLSSLERLPPRPSGQGAPTLADRWIVARRHRLVREVDRLFAAFQFGEAGRQIQEFLWGEFADWYLEIAKLQMESGAASQASTLTVMVESLDTVLRLLHPYAPFVTEELWGRLRTACQSSVGAYAPRLGWEEALIIARWPAASPEAEGDRRAAEEFGLVMELVGAIRTARAEKGVPPSRRISASIAAGSQAGRLRAQAPVLARLAGIEPDSLRIEPLLSAPDEEAMRLVVRDLAVFLPFAGMIDKAEEVQRLVRDLVDRRRQVRRLTQLLGGPFGEKAPGDVIQRESERRDAYFLSAGAIESELLQFGFDDWHALET